MDRTMGSMHQGSSQHYDESQKERSFGERLVRVDFNPSTSDVVHQLKTKYAEIANILYGMKGTAPRLASIAITELESSCHYAVKAATGPDA